MPRLIEDINRCFLLSSINKMVATGNLTRADKRLFESTEWDVYALFVFDDYCGQLFIDGKEVYYNAGDIITLKPGKHFMLKPDPVQTPSGWLMAFSNELLRGTALGRDLYMFSFMHANVCQPITLTKPEQSTIATLCNAISAELQGQPDHLATHLLQLQVETVLCHVKRAYDRQYALHTDEQSIAFRMRRAVEAYVTSGLPNQQGTPDVAWCAREIGYSPRHLSLLLHRETGMSAQEYLQLLMTEKAEALIADTTMSINDISSAIGFQHTQHFIRMFRARTGMTPIQYRHAGRRPLS